MLRPDEIQSAFVAYLKTKSEITVLLPDGEDEIREDQWQGQIFTYPNIRVKQLPMVVRDSSCDVMMCTFSILVFSEQSSSAEADKITGIINTILHRRSFVSQTVRYVMYITNIIPAIRVDERTWRSEVLIKATVS